MISALGLDNLASVRVLVDLHHANALIAFANRDTTVLLSTWIEDSDDVSERFPILGQQCFQIGLELNFLLEPGVILEKLKMGQLLSKRFFCRTELRKSGDFLLRSRC